MAAVDGPQIVVRIHGALDDVTVGRPHDRVGGLRLDHVLLRRGRLLVLDPPRTLRIMCAAVPGRLTVVPDAASPAGPAVRA